MLKRMVLINSANFQYADIDLSKEVFFVGDNASGKTTTTRALHFLYNGDGQKLGIPNSKSTFSKHYFAHDDSYIFYVFESFFIFTYKKGDTIRRWFSKQEFDVNNVINNKKLLDFKTIEKYVKSASLSCKPQTIEEYTSILYGQNKKYLDFSIAKIKGYKIFLNLFNMIFNIDKAIVTAKDIKEAIQKSLNRKDEVLNIDYDDFIRKLNRFSSSYHFFRTFDNNRGILKKAIKSKDVLLDYERIALATLKAIAYRYEFELQEFNKIKTQIDEISVSIKKKKESSLSIKQGLESFRKRINKKEQDLTVELRLLETLNEKFQAVDIEENTLLANNHTSLEKEWTEKNYSLSKLKDKQSTVQKEIENQIELLKNKINVTIPNIAQNNFRKLKDIEDEEYEKNKTALYEEYDIEFTIMNDGISSDQEEVNKLNETIRTLDSKELIAKETLEEKYDTDLKIAKSSIEIQEKKVDGCKTNIRELNTKKDKQHSLIQLHNEKYRKLRDDNATILSSKRVKFNKKIANARAILNPIPNSFNAFLSDNIDGWERDIYPILDENLLRISSDKLKPEIIESSNLLGFKFDSSELKSIPTKEEAIGIIAQTRDEKYRLLKTSKDVYHTNLAVLDEDKHAIEATMESIGVELNTQIDEKSKYDAEIEKLEITIKDLRKELKENIDTVNLDYNEQRSIVKKKITTIQVNIEQKNTDIKELRYRESIAAKKLTINRDHNIEVQKKKENRKAQDDIKKLQEEISILGDSISTLDENDLINQLTKEVASKKEELDNAAEAIRYLDEYEESKEMIATLPLKESELKKLELYMSKRERSLEQILSDIKDNITSLLDNKTFLEESHSKYNKGINTLQNKKIELPQESLQTEEYLIDLIRSYEDTKREYGNEKSNFRQMMDRLRSLEKHAEIELNLSTESFDESESVSELKNIMYGLAELESFEKHKYDSEKKRRHNDFKTFLKNTATSKIRSFSDLENDFEKQKASINKSLSHANFGVIRDIRLDTDISKKRNDSISALLQDLSKKINDTVGLYSNKSLFYQDEPKSVKNIEDIQNILEEIKKKGSKGSINLFDTIDLSISYVENGKKVQNKENIKDDSSSGGNIMLKVAIAMSILNRYAQKTTNITPFFLIVDEISKLQNKNQELLRDYINVNGFRTLYITPDPAYPDPDRALYYTFKNIQEEGETLEIRQMNII